jgi:hypothetical protein
LNALQGGVYFHPGKQKSLAIRFATPEAKTPLEGCGFGLQQL